uniref:Uncharacterized protein n=1 Tax=Romanomermis culicivorax TaxID=13658 RepID=A0A915I1U1_ROMCU
MLSDELLPGPDCPIARAEPDNVIEPAMSPDMNQQMIATDDQPFSVVENSGFIDLIKKIKNSTNGTKNLALTQKSGKILVKNLMKD